MPSDYVGHGFKRFSRDRDRLGSVGLLAPFLAPGVAPLAPPGGRCAEMLRHVVVSGAPREKCPNVLNGVPAIFGRFELERTGLSQRSRYFSLLGRCGTT